MSREEKGTPGNFWTQTSDQVYYECNPHLSSPLYYSASAFDDGFTVNFVFQNVSWSPTSMMYALHPENEVCHFFLEFLDGVSLVTFPWVPVMYCGIGRGSGGGSGGRIGGGWGGTFHAL